MTNSSAPTLLRSAQAARILSVSSETLRLWERDGKLPFDVERTAGGQRRYPAAQVQALSLRIRDADGAATDVLDAARNMVMVARAQDMGGGVIAEQDGEGGIGYWGGLSPNPLSVEPDHLHVPDVEIPWTADELTDGREAVSLAYHSDGAPCAASVAEGRYGGQNISIGFAVLTGLHAGRVVDLRLEFPPSKRGEVSGQWIEALVGEDMSHGATTAIDIDELIDLLECQLFQLTIKEVEVDAWGMEDTTRLAHGGLGARVDIGQPVKLRPLAPVHVIESHAADAGEFDFTF